VAAIVDVFVVVVVVVKYVAVNCFYFDSFYPYFDLNVYPSSTSSSSPSLTTTIPVIMLAVDFCGVMDNGVNINMITNKLGIKRYDKR
ncbi:hypothetical protein DERP_001594, partial [Dermatophagoides pteronyssinus]